MPALSWAFVEEQPIPELEWLLQMSVLFVLAQEDLSDGSREDLLTYLPYRHEESSLCTPR